MFHKIFVEVDCFVASPNKLASMHVMQFCSQLNSFWKLPI